MAREPRLGGRARRHRPLRPYWSAWREGCRARCWSAGRAACPASAASRRAAEGQPAVVLVVGEAGVGKSRLVGEFRDRAVRSGARVLVGGCVACDEGGTLPWAPVVELLARAVRSVEPQVLDALVGIARDELGDCCPSWAGRTVRSDPNPPRRAALRRPACWSCCWTCSGRQSGRAAGARDRGSSLGRPCHPGTWWRSLARRLRDERLLLAHT
jgi:hypothetical protein